MESKEWAFSINQTSWKNTLILGLCYLWYFPKNLLKKDNSLSAFHLYVMCISSCQVQIKFISSANSNFQMSSLMIKWVLDTLSPHCSTPEEDYRLMILIVVSSFIILSLILIIGITSCILICFEDYDHTHCDLNNHIQKVGYGKYYFAERAFR